MNGYSDETKEDMYCFLLQIGLHNQEHTFFHVTSYPFEKQWCICHKLHLSCASFVTLNFQKTLLHRSSLFQWLARLTSYLLTYLWLFIKNLLEFLLCGIQGGGGREGISCLWNTGGNFVPSHHYWLSSCSFLPMLKPHPHPQSRADSCLMC